MDVRYKKITKIPELIGAIRLRIDVFIIEQGCPPGWEPDKLDEISDQYIAVVDEIVVATGRLLEKPKGVVKIERMAVKKEYRGKGIGKGLTNFIIEQARKLKPTKIGYRPNPKYKNFMKRWDLNQFLNNTIFTIPKYLISIWN